MSKQKACLDCRKIFSEDKCPICSSGASSETFKGKVFIFNPQDSKIAKNMKINHKGEFAIKTK